MNKVYILMHGHYGHEGHIEKVFQLKKDAIRHIKSQNIKYVKRRIWECDKHIKWYRIDCHEVVEGEK